jgi:hypothetical protein
VRDRGYVEREANDLAISRCNKARGTGFVGWFHAHISHLMTRFKTEWQKAGHRSATPRLKRNANSLTPTSLREQQNKGKANMKSVQYPLYAKAGKSCRPMHVLPSLSIYLTAPIDWGGQYQVRRCCNSVSATHLSSRGSWSSFLSFLPFSKSKSIQNPHIYNYLYLQSAYTFSLSLLQCHIVINMDDVKAGHTQSVEVPSSREGEIELRSYSKLGGTEADERDMQMLGRTQQLNVYRSLPTKG